DPQLNTHGAQYQKLQQELAKLSTRYGEKHPVIISLKTEIAALEKHLTESNSTKREKKNPEQVSGVLQSPYVQQLKKEFGMLEADLKALHTEEQSVMHSIALYQQRVEKPPRRDQELQLLQRDYDTAKGLYQSLLKRQEEGKLGETLE